MVLVKTGWTLIDTDVVTVAIIRVRDLDVPRLTVREAKSCTAVVLTDDAVSPVEKGLISWAVVRSGHLTHKANVVSVAVREVSGNGSGATTDGTVRRDTFCDAFFAGATFSFAGFEVTLRAAGEGVVGVGAPIVQTEVVLGAVLGVRHLITGILAKTIRFTGVQTEDHPGGVHSLARPRVTRISD